MTESREQLQQELQLIVKWEREQKDLWFWEKLGRLPFALLDKWTPRVIQDKIGTALNEIGKFIQTGGSYLVSEKTILEKLQQEARRSGERIIPEGVLPADTPLFLTLPEAKELSLAVMNRVADGLRDSRSTIATVQGATTGFGGVFTLAVDIPAMLGLSLKLLQELAVCYGFDPKDEKERMFIVKCLQFSSSDIVGKKAILEELAEYDNRSSDVQVMSQLQGWREVVTVYRDNFGLKKLFQLVPIAGALFGAYANRDALLQVAEAGTMLYRKRRILERLNSNPI
ncbi:EcsC family protein [Paenibacillus sp. H1-7]|uniref:EcsC family protein n=2 Tax=Bacillati TaxID=1783272 RepID=UPI001EF8EE43|nr:EcsC family protein [Paenibacillus sp. H1-7]ULL18500.1 EcsC family protein [Paenibacillus sp. H1-7]